MKPKLSVSLEFLHLENAIFCAEQSVSAGVDIIEIGSTLLKSTGLTSIKVLRERFPEVTLVADMKVQSNVESEIKAVADAGANSVTISGNVSPQIWQQSLEVAKEHSVNVILDFRDVVHPRRHINKNIPDGFDTIMLSLQQPSFALLQKTTSILTTPIGVQGVEEEDDIVEAISLGASVIGIRFSDAKEKSIQEAVKSILKILSNAKRTFPKDPVSLHEEQLLQLLEQVSPSDFCEVSDKPCFLESVYPVQKYTKIAGKAATLKVWPGAELAVLDFLMKMESHCILVIDAGGRGSAVWGQMATEIAIKKELVGVVVYGSIKDVNKIREKGLPCYTSSITPIITKNQDSSFSGNCPLKIGEVFIKPGDWLIGDDTGVISISQQDIFFKTNEALKRYNERMEIIRGIEGAKDKDLEELVHKYKKLHL
ncbi:orotidine 5'-phosphate decarboxylase / HUMPS family protein [Candidatus Uabimicrobium sp. HlEnr_7]|uniref:orotidine 5'-phosphate decarboxylase / HUMPS family protein n=1 Tax=Candidatus Uabimicrobium helgolandensis TaxID=3095367 RepID=UPI00355741EF